MNAALATRHDTNFDDRMRTARTWLLERAQQLRERLTRVERNLRREGELAPRDYSDVAIIEENDEILRGIAKAARGELTHIEHAQARLEEGTYGLCERCGKEIGSGRLAAIPYATECRGCARDG